MKDARAVLAALDGSEVPHAAEILRGLADGTITIEHADFSGAGTSCAHLHDIYEFRSRQRGPNASAHSKKLREDGLQLTESLARHKERSCYIIGLSKEPNVSYGLFVLTDFSAFLGCFMSYDHRKTPESEWERIWRTEEEPNQPPESTAQAAVARLELGRRKMSATSTVDEQKRICAKYGAAFCSCAPDERAGVALQTLARAPIYGVRKKNQDGSASWYIWAGPHSSEVDFYQPACAGHLDELLPIVLPYLALPPGYKFIIDRGGFEDVWFEEEKEPKPPPEPTS